MSALVAGIACAGLTVVLVGFVLVGGAAHALAWIDSGRRS